MKESIAKVLDMYKTEEIDAIAAEKLISALWDSSAALEDDGPDTPWEDDSKLRIVAYIGKKLVQKSLFGTTKGKRDMENVVVKLDGDAHDVECWFNLECANVSGNANSGGGLSVGGDVGGGANCGGGLSVRGDVGGGANCGGGLSVGGNVGDHANCGGGLSVRGNVEGSVKAGGSVRCGNVGGNVESNTDVTCGDVAGSVTGRNVNCNAQTASSNPQAAGADFVSSIDSIITGSLKQAAAAMKSATNSIKGAAATTTAATQRTAPVSTLWGDDGVLRLAAYIGTRLIDSKDAPSADALKEFTVNLDDVDVANVESWFSVKCSDVNGDITAGDSVTVEGDVDGDITAGDDATVGGDVDGDITAAGGSVTVGVDVDGDITAGGSVTVEGDVGGDVDCGGDLTCGDIEGNVKCDGNINPQSK